MDSPHTVYTLGTANKSGKPKILYTLAVEDSFNFPYKKELINGMLDSASSYLEITKTSNGQYRSVCSMLIAADKDYDRIKQTGYTELGEKSIPILLNLVPTSDPKFFILANMVLMLDNKLNVDQVQRLINVAYHRVEFTTHENILNGREPRLQGLGVIKGDWIVKFQSHLCKLVDLSYIFSSASTVDGQPKIPENMVSGLKLSRYLFADSVKSKNYSRALKAVPEFENFFKNYTESVGHTPNTDDIIEYFSQNPNENINFGMCANHLDYRE